MLLAAPLALTCGVIVAVAARHGDAHQPPAATRARLGAGPILAEGSDWRPSDTAEDWVTYADHVIGVHPVAEREVPPTAFEFARGEGLISRDLTLHVDQVLWSHSDAARPAPGAFHWLAWGWQFTGGDTRNRVEMATEGTPRVESGHSYIMALAWSPERCSPGDDPVPAQWRVLGSGALLPYDDATVGAGESQGQVRSGQQAQAAADTSGPTVPVKDGMAGRSGAALANELRGTHPGKPEQFEPPSAVTSCG